MVPPEPTLDDHCCLMFSQLLLQSEDLPCFIILHRFPDHLDGLLLPDLVLGESLPWDIPSPSGLNNNSRDLLHQQFLSFLEMFLYLGGFHEFEIVEVGCSVHWVNGSMDSGNCLEVMVKVCNLEHDILPLLLPLVHVHSDPVFNGGFPLPNHYLEGWTQIVRLFYYFICEIPVLPMIFLFSIPSPRSLSSNWNEVAVWHIFKVYHCLPLHPFHTHRSHFICIQGSKIYRTLQILNWSLKEFLSLLDPWHSWFWQKLNWFGQIFGREFFMIPTSPWPILQWTHVW